jgi:hypothetical protein
MRGPAGPWGARAEGRGEDKIGASGRSPPVVSKAGWGGDTIWGVPGPQPVEGTPLGSENSHKGTSATRAMRAGGSTRANVFQSARQAGVRTSLFQHAGMRAPAGVQPGQLPRVAWGRMGLEGTMLTSWENRADGAGTGAAKGDVEADVGADDEGEIGLQTTKGRAAAGWRGAGGRGAGWAGCAKTAAGGARPGAGGAGGGASLLARRSLISLVASVSSRRPRRRTCSHQNGRKKFRLAELTEWAASEEERAMAA